jgi:hypothetical protein
MDKKKITKLERKGWKVGDASDFFGLSKDEEAYIELKILQKIASFERNLPLIGGRCRRRKGVGLLKITEPDLWAKS